MVVVVVVVWEGDGGVKKRKKEKKKTIRDSDFTDASRVFAAVSTGTVIKGPNNKT